MKNGTYPLTAALLSSPPSLSSSPPPLLPLFYFSLFPFLSLLLLVSLSRCLSVVGGH